MRILINGGVWKNTEDEILKAAVMKYGKNQWARVASLLNRKSAKQCKARWYEWLDPSIKKTEWSRDEEEKLLHLAKLMPNQWRTIAPMVGRTAAQCMEQYERLLDMAQEKQAAAAEDAEGEDPRALRAGEVDPAPETKPARPDPIDMDEDEKEMLSEARARLANTMGKKAKRKARERQLDESRRLSMLQKRRELKAAGIESKLSGGSHKRKFIDYAREIPFQKIVPSGYYDVSSENSKTKLLKMDPAALGRELRAMEGKHEKEEEERERQRDKSRLKALFKANAPLAIKLVEEQNDPAAVRRRVPLSLPAPQVSDFELEQIARMDSTGLMGPPEGGLSGTATQSLVGDYSAAMRPTPTPMRTPQQQDVIMQEARNQRILREMTPLLGNDLLALQEGTGFEGATPRLSKMATPNTLIATPMTQLSSATPQRGTPSVAGSTRSGLTSSSSAVVRDHFGLNEPDSFSLGEFASVSSRADKLRDKQMKAQLAAQLKGLPEPEYTYDISIPAAPEEQPDDQQRAEDAADLEERQREMAAAAERDELARRSTVLRRNLPRPFLVSGRTTALTGPSPQIHNDPALLMASSLVNEEATRLISRDNQLFPDATLPPTEEVDEATIVAGNDVMDDFILQQSREAITEEFTRRQYKEQSVANYPVFVSEWETAFERHRYVPSTQAGTGGGVYKVPANSSETIASLEQNLAAIKARFEKDMKKSAKLEQKVSVLTAGYTARRNKLIEYNRQIQRITGNLHGNRMF